MKSKLCENCKTDFFKKNLSDKVWDERRFCSRGCGFVGRGKNSATFWTKEEIDQLRLMSERECQVKDFSLGTRTLYAAAKKMKAIGLAVPSGWIKKKSKVRPEHKSNNLKFTGVIGNIYKTIPRYLPESDRDDICQMIALDMVEGKEIGEFKSYNKLLRKKQYPFQEILGIEIE